MTRVYKCERFFSFTCGMRREENMFSVGSPAKALLIL